ncbi:hypothetical protein ACFLXF_00460 [Chloroflexota bacterium]
MVKKLDAKPKVALTITLGTVSLRQRNVWALFWKRIISDSVKEIRNRDRRNNIKEVKHGTGKYQTEN